MCLCGVVLVFAYVLVWDRHTSCACCHSLLFLSCLTFNLSLSPVHTVRTCCACRGSVGPCHNGRAGAGLQSRGCDPCSRCSGAGLVVGGGGRPRGLVSLQLCASELHYDSFGVMNVKQKAHSLKVTLEHSNTSCTVAPGDPRGNARCVITVPWLTGLEEMWLYGIMLFIVLSCTLIHPIVYLWLQQDESIRHKDAFYQDFL